MRYLDPKNDITFKRVFGEHPHILRSFLNSIMLFEGDQTIVELEYMPTELFPDIPQLRNSIVDVRCRDQSGQQFIIEVQMVFVKGFFSRVLYNASKVFGRQLYR